MVKLITVYLLLIPISVYAQFSSQTKIQADEIVNNTSTNITINPVNNVIIPYLNNGELLYYNSGLDSLANGSENQILSIVGGILTWIDPPATLPDQTGNAGKFLQTDGTVESWQDVVSSPITTQGDISIGDVSGNPVRLPVGLVDQILISNGTTLTYQDPPISVPTTLKGEISGHDGTTPVAIPAPTQNGQFLESDDTEYSGWKVSNSILANIGQAQFVGSLNWKESNCLWRGSSNTFASFSIDNDCAVSNILGNVASPDTAIPAIKILSPRTDGQYRVEFNIPFFSNSANPSCRASLSSTGSFEDQGIGYVDSNTINAGTFTGNFKFNNNTDKTIQLIYVRDSGTDDCLAYGEPNLSAKMTVHFFPDSNSLAAIQNTELTAKTANVLSFMVDSSGNVSQENYDWIDGNCTLSDSNRNRNCVFTASLNNSEPMNCSVTQEGGVTGGFSQSIQSISTSGLTVRALQADTSASLQPIHVICSKQGVDVNKSQVIAGTFENINSSELEVIRGESNGSQAITANTTPITFNEIKDDLNSFNGQVFTAKKQGYYIVNGSIFTLATTTARIESYINGTKSRLVGEPDSSSTLIKISGIEFLEIGDALEFRSSQNITLNPNNAFHNIHIQEFPDTESIIKNLNNNSTKKCQTKTLSSNVSTTGIITDFIFNNMDITKRYSINSSFHVNDSSGTVENNFIFININNFERSVFSHSQASNTGIFISNTSPSVANIRPTSSTVNVNISAINGGISLQSGSWVEICENGDNVISTTQFN